LQDVPPRVGISACLLGHAVRWDGRHKHDRFLAEDLAGHVEWVSVCPEVEAGLGVPREPIALVRSDGDVRLVARDTARDLTETMRRFAADRLRGLSLHPLCGWVLKARSPSCGLAAPVTGAPDDERRAGAFAEPLRIAFPDLPIEEEAALEDDRAREAFVARVFALHRWHRVRHASPAAVAAYHGRHRLLLASRDPDAAAALEALVAAGGTSDVDEDRAREYRRAFEAAMRRVPQRADHLRVLRDTGEGLAARVPPEDRAVLGESLSRYAAGEVPLADPLRVLRGLARRQRIPELGWQTYLEPHPPALGLLERI
jgi:uncharacterized protein YbbK (DUF523 family)/uncharacterized protein YbgA (DUF1722 family)